MNLIFFGTEIDLKRIINSALYILFVLIVYLILKRILKIIFVRAGGKNAGAAHKQRIKTISKMLSSILRYVFLVILLLVVLAVLGVNVTSLLAGLGIFKLRCRTSRN